MPQFRIHNTQVDAFIWAYITALFWTTSEDEFPEYCYSGEFSINKDDADRLSGDTLLQIIQDCNNFCDQVNAVLTENDKGDYMDQIDSSQAGHDFALTRNRTGCGFSDRDASTYGTIPRDTMDRLARTFQEFVLYKGDDGKIYA